MSFECDRDENLKLVLKNYNKTSKDLEDYLNIVYEWIKTQPHLPEVPPRVLATAFLVACKFSIEKVKKKLDMYYTVRTLIPDFFVNRNPKLPYMNEALKLQILGVVPKLTPEGYQITLLNVDEFGLNKYDPNVLMSIRFQFIEILLHTNYSAGDIYLEDFSKFPMSNVWKLTPTFLKNATMVYFNSLPSRFIGYHVFNVPTYCDQIFSLVKQFMKPKLRDRVNVYRTLEEFKAKNAALVDMLPVEYGGNDEYTLKQIQDTTMKMFKEFQPRFDELEKLKTDESKRPVPLVNDEVLGYYGNFKKIDFD